MSSTVRSVGKCCAGDLCKFPSLELCNAHKCNACNEVVHMLCGSQVKDDSGNDIITCRKCEVIKENNKSNDSQSVINKVVTLPDSPANQTEVSSLTTLSVISGKNVQ